jgi:hypothetical protein
MPELSPKTKQYHKQRVRSVMVQQPMVTIVGIQKHLAADGLPLDRGYIASLVRAIQTERIKRADTWMLNSALAAFQDAMGEIARVGWDIANDQMASGRDRAAGLKEAREAYNDMFQMLFDAGVFERKLGTLDMAIRNTPLSEERKQALSATFGNWGLIEPPMEDVTPTTIGQP